jgi:hypothetical protein
MLIRTWYRRSMTCSANLTLYCCCCYCHCTMLLYTTGPITKRAVSTRGIPEGCAYAVSRVHECFPRQSGEHFKSSDVALMTVTCVHRHVHERSGCSMQAVAHLAAVCIVLRVSVSLTWCLTVLTATLTATSQ